MKKIWQNEDKHLIFHLHNTPTYLKMYTNFENTRSIGAEKFHWRERKMNKYKGLISNMGFLLHNTTHHYQALYQISDS